MTVPVARPALAGAACVEPAASRGLSRRRGLEALAAAGIFLVVGSAYALSGPGRIDMVDGQFRYEVARSIVTSGDFAIHDPALAPLGAPGVDGRRFAIYSVAPSLAAAPLVWLGLRVGDADGEVARFLFSFTSGVFGAALAAMLYLAYRRLGVPPSQAVAWTAVSSFATLLWPVAASTFDQVQHGTVLFLVVLLGRESATRRSLAWAAAAGVCGAILLNFQESYALLLPSAAIAVFGEEDRRSRAGWARYVTLGAVAALGLVAWGLYNEARFGVPFASGKPVWFQSPIAGVLSFAVSPGRSILLFSPPVLVAFAGMPALLRISRSLGAAIVSTSVIHILFISSIAYFSGDWCWGPRYLVPLLPLWALAFPFARRLPATVRGSVVTLGVVVQLLALSLDHQGFYFQRARLDEFWRDRWISFSPSESQLLARPGEIVSVLRNGAPPEVRWFAPSPYRRLLTYCFFGNPLPQRAESPRWMRSFLAFYLPRPWPAWMALFPPERRPIALSGAVLAFCGALAGGAALVGVRLRAAAGARDVPRPREVDRRPT